MNENEVTEAEVVPLQLITSVDHPHYNESGWIDKDQFQHVTGQYYFKLSNCLHGVAGCYVLETDLDRTNSELDVNKNRTKPTSFDPYKYTPYIRDLLVEAFTKSYNVAEACQHAGINRDTYYVWLKEIEGFQDIMDEAKARPLKKAKSVIDVALNAGDVSTAKWYVERRDPDFKSKAEIDNNIGLQETRDKIKEFLDDNSADDSSEQPSAADSADTGNEVAEATEDLS